ncbi:MAG: hypothetical protein QXG67_00950 [Candidatus Nitrosotenuis sp.]|uniref:Uncharacterized protein n=1 Tax=Candidatus Nitrosotenuis uzonensis TaxID=1407055 RepID=A0A812EZ33_9ARCH|nr:hypothetical protein [Candidatus Nitrosotenuis uzonensis]MCA2003440.1 hypothetical protein [Candidatus Nitrosotenuis sp.]CAE6486308.1 conserved hypothetical protein [Candidatus Nitrosotenuis uzonensis]
MVRKILLVPMGVMFGAAAIALTYPLIVGLPGSEQNVVPRFASQWYVGKGVETTPSLQYLVRYQEMEFLAELKFLGSSGDEQNVQVTIDDKKTNRHIEQIMQLGRAYVFVDPPEEIKPYIKALDKTVLSIRDAVIEPKYLVVGADWGTIYIGKFTPKLTITDYADNRFEFGILKTYTLSYKINNIESSFLIADNIPLPLKGEVYTLDGNLEYFFEAVQLE